MDGGAFAPHKTACLERGVFREKRSAFGVGARGERVGDGEGILELQLSYGGGDIWSDVMWYQVWLDSCYSTKVRRLTWRQ